MHLDGGEHTVGTGCTFRCCCWFAPFCGLKALKNCVNELFVINGVIAELN